jgi:hypothetical protein
VEVYPSDADIFEYGILVESTDSPIPLNRVASTRLPIYSGYTLCVVDSNGTSLNDRAVRLFVPVGPHAVADFLEEGDLRYCLLAMLYHMNHLIDLYVTGCRTFETDSRIRSACKGNFSDPRIFYEVDALLTVARRVYESVRKVLWKHYMPGQKGRWRSIKNALESDRIPGDFRTILNDSWKSVGEDLAAYRDCLAHYDPLTDGATTCWMEPIANRWGMTIKLPANPKSKGRGRHNYDFDAGPEALAYCHELACHLVGLCEALQSQTAIATQLANPGVRRPE